MTEDARLEFGWTPQLGPQEDAISATWCTELFFGGARGGGKSDFLLGDFLQDVLTYGRHWQGVLFRRSYPELQEIIKRSKTIYTPCGAIWREGNKEWRFHNGASLKMRSLESPGDAAKFQGHQYTWIGKDELTQWDSDEAYLKLMACLRSAEMEIPTKRIRSSGNPGGPGHSWVKRRFVDPFPLGYQVFEENSTTRLYIPSRVQDNSILLARDPEYVERLKQVGSQELVKAWLDGDWNVVLGAYFDEFSITEHVVPPFEIPSHWLRFGAMDWGSSAPFVFQWFAVSDGTGDYPPGALIMYRELYGASEPNKGLKLPADEVAKMILSKMDKDETKYIVCDPACFKRDGGPSVAERMANAGLMMRPADNTRVAGWDQVRARLRGYDKKPMLYFFSTCKDIIRTLPALQHDDHRPEDVDTNGDDHSADTLRYGCMSRPWTEFMPEAKKRKTLRDVTLNDLWKEQRYYEQERD
ncbi:MAG: terminase family protein [Candidatus Riesia sp.]|nr:terminase family protein [Candidatus Riesia sp.]